MDAYTSSTKMKKLLIILLLPLAGFAQGVQNGSSQDLFLTGASGLTATVNNILPDGATSANGTDMSGYGSALVQIISTATGGQLIFEGSNFLNANYVTIPVWNQITATGIPITAAITPTVSQIGYWIPKKFRYIRCRIAATITGGTVQAVTTLSRTDTDPNYFQVSNGTGANLAVSGTVTANIGTGNLAGINAGTNLIGDVGIQYRTTAAGAGTPTILNSPATPAIQTVKGSAGRLIGVYVTNANASVRYLKVFNIVSPTLGTSSATLDIPIPPSNNPIFISFEGGIAFGTAITVAITGGRGATDNTGITLNDCTGFTVHN